jgi:hypothetical protein
MVHIGKNNGEDWGAGAFISDSVLITVRHFALGLRNLELIQYRKTEKAPGKSHSRIPRR